MASRRGARGLGVASLALVAGAALALGNCGLTRPELTVIVISLDTTRPDHLSAYGYERPTTPHLARLAAEGVRFDDARAPTSWTLPSHMSLFTGQPPGVHDVVIDFQVLDRGHRTLGEIFKDGDFRTMGVFSAPYVHPHFGFGRGFDYYERATQDPMLFDLTREQRRASLGVTEHRSHTEVTSSFVVDRGVALLRHSNDPRNLLFLHFFDPHYDYRAPKRLAKAFTDPAYHGPVTGQDLSQITGGPEAVLPDMAPADEAQLRALYDAELAWVDENIGRLLEALAAQGRLEHTLIVVTADHGEEFFEHGRFGHRNGLSEQTLRVPLLVWGPGLGVPAGRVVKDTVATYDILPTLVDYADLPDEALYGRSLRPLVEGKALPARPASAALTFMPPQPMGWYELHRAVAMNGLKLVSRVRVAWSQDAERNLSGEVLPDSEQVHVYDVIADPLERRDLSLSDSPEDRTRVAQIRSVWDEEWKRQKEAVQLFVSKGVPVGSDTGLTLLEQMQAMGYVGGAEDAPEGAGR